MTVEKLEPEPKRFKSPAAVVNSNDCITFTLLNKNAEGAVVIEDGASFKPDMSHQYD